MFGGGVSTVVARATPQRASVEQTPRVVVAHSGKQHAYRHALALQSAGYLDRFVTTSYYKPQRLPDRLAACWPKADRILRRRRLEELDDDRVYRRWRYEVPEVLARTVWGVGSTADRFMYRRDAAFDRWVSRRHATASDIYWGFQGSCLESLRAARGAGRIAVAEFATAHVTAAMRILSHEAERHPEWAATISNLHFPDWYRERLEQEPHEASVCVAASGFTIRSLVEAGVPNERIKLLPLGADLSRFQPLRRSRSGKFRILFIGGVGQRKGVKYLLDAYRRIESPGIELRLVGPLPADLGPLKPYRDCVTLTGRVDQAEVLRELYAAHVLVLPSVFEGFGLVIPEAMATGIPVIASTHTAAPEIIRDGRDGFVLEPDDLDGLAERLGFLATDREAAEDMGREAAIRAHQYSWNAHQARLTALLQDLV
jgi:glycosyltransferase involved in cell wall biosynthesis